MYRVIEITAKERQKYNEFAQKYAMGSVHQTLAWGEFQSKSAGRNKFWIFAVENSNGQIMASVLIIRQKLPFNKCWFYSPRGPLLDYQNKEICDALFGKIAALAHQQNAVFFRFDPPILISDTKSKENFQDFLKEFSACLAHAHYQPESTLILDLTLSTEALLVQMKPKGRYNIKIAQKHGVQIKVSDDNPQSDISIFYKLLKQTITRDQFSAHSLGYYQALFEVFNALDRRCASADEKIELHIPRAKLYLASYQQKPVAAIIVTYFKDTATYYFGASGDQYRNVMAPYLLQWQAILDAKIAGYHYYDFFGIAPENDLKHPWAGVSDFKLKFGGRRVDYYPAQEIIYQPFWHNLIKLAKWIKKLL